MENIRWRVVSYQPRLRHGRNTSLRLTSMTIIPIGTGIPKLSPSTSTVGAGIKAGAHDRFSRSDRNKVRASSNCCLKVRSRIEDRLESIAIRDRHSHIVTLYPKGYVPAIV